MHATKKPKNKRAHRHINQDSLDHKKQASIHQWSQKVYSETERRSPDLYTSPHSPTICTRPLASYLFYLHFEACYINTFVQRKMNKNSPRTKEGALYNERVNYKMTVRAFLTNKEDALNIFSKCLIRLQSEVKAGHKLLLEQNLFPSNETNVWCVLVCCAFPL